MKTDYQIQEDVMDELKWEPALSSAEIGVAVKGGAVTLSGIVDSFYKKLCAEKATKKVAGVKAIAEDIQIGVSPANKKTDSEIAGAVINALQWRAAVHEDKIQIKVENGNVRLDGEVEWEYERKSVAAAIENLNGLRSVLNLITVKPKITPGDIRQKINYAFHRSATIDAAKIITQVSGTKVTLHGKVRSLAEKEDAEAAAWNAPGVSSVISELKIEVPEFSFEE